MTIEDAIKKALDILIAEGRQKLVAKGLQNKNNLYNSLDKLVYQMGNDFVGEYTGLSYGLIQERGIKKENIPFTPNSGQKKSLYIEALIQWVQDKGFAASVERAKGIAFGIAHRHKLVGMHEVGGVFNPSKQGWLSESIDATSAEIDEIIYAAMDDNMDMLIDNALIIAESYRNKQ